jgi:PAS domain S-box-containing protein
MFLGSSLATVVVMRQSAGNVAQEVLAHQAQGVVGEYRRLLDEFQQSSAGLASGDTALAAVLQPVAADPRLREVLEHSALHELFSASVLVQSSAHDAAAGGRAQTDRVDAQARIPGPIAPQAGVIDAAVEGRRLALNFPLVNPATGIAVGRLLSSIDLDVLLARVVQVLPQGTQWSLRIGGGGRGAQEHPGRLDTPVRTEGALQFLDLHVQAQRDPAGRPEPWVAADYLSALVLSGFWAIAVLALLRWLRAATSMPPGTPPTAAGPRVDSDGCGPGPSTRLDREHEDESYLRAAMSNPDEVLACVADSGRRILFISDAALRLTDRTPQELMADSQGLLSLFSESHRELMHAMIGMAAAGMPAVLRAPAARSADAGGLTRWLEIRYRKAEDRDADTAVCLVRDATDDMLLEANRAALDAELGLRDRALAVSKNGVEIISGRDSGFRVQYVNPAQCRMTGFTSEDLIGKPSRILDVQDAGDTHPKLLAAMNTGKGCASLHRAWRQDGSRFWQQVSIAPIDTQNPGIVRFIAVYEDVDRAVEAANALHEREARLSHMFAVSPDGLALLDSNGHVFMANDALLRFSGRDREQVVSHSLEEISRHMELRATPGEAWEGLPRVPAVVPYVDDHPQQRRQSKRHTLHLQHPTRVLVCSVRQITTAVDTEYVLYLRDITREHAFNTMKSEFLSTATHELRTPMACVLGFAEMLAEGLSTPEEAPEHARLIYAQASEMSRTLDDLLDLARMEAQRAGALHFAPESAAGIANELARTWRVTGDPRCVQLQVTCAAEVSVSVDPQKIRQVLRNLLSNAFKYSTAPSPVSLAVHADPVGPVVFTVTDEGIGMKPDEARHAFDRFYRAESTAGVRGTGLGLSVVKQIVELHGGTVRLESTFGERTVISVALPQILYASAVADPLGDGEGEGGEAT